jgi:hypothetical protein
MSVELWLPAVASLFALEDGRGGTIRSVHMFDQAFPEAVGEADVPLALTFADGFRPQFSLSGPQRDHWTGWTEFYLTKNLDKTGLLYVAKFASRIRNAVAAHQKLSSAVDLFSLQDIEKPIELPVVLAYGSQQLHYGAIVRWKVIESTASLTVGL